MNLDGSLERILRADHEFGDLFYDVFFEQHPDAKQYFKNTNMKSQGLMLSMSLRLIGDFHKRGFSAIKHYLQMLGTRHDDHKVPREMYPKWRDSLLVALEKFHDSDWDDSLANEWRTAIDAISLVMYKGYDERTGV
jgi:hemoglobin-like flavoprotein